MGWSEEDEEEGSEEGEEEEEGEESEEEEIVFKLPPALQRQFLASDDEEPEKQTGELRFFSGWQLYAFCIYSLVGDIHPFSRNIGQGLGSKEEDILRS